MTLQTILIFGVMCVGCFIYYKFTMNKANAVTADFDKEAVKNNIETHTSEIVNSQLPYLKKWIKEEPIDSFTDASIPVSLKNKAKNAAVDAAKSIAWRAVGVKAKYNRVDTSAHLVLSNDNLHFVSANVDGDLETHITFTKDQLINAKIEFTGPKKGADLASGVSDFLSTKLNNEDAMVNVFAITLTVDGQPITIQAHDKIVLPYTMGTSDYTKNALTANIIADNFFNKLSEKYPNLKASKVKMVS